MSELYELTKNCISIKELIRALSFQVLVNGQPKDSDVVNHIYTTISGVAQCHIDIDDIIKAGSSFRFHWHHGKYDYYTIDDIWLYSGTLIVDLKNPHGGISGGRAFLDELEYVKESIS